MSNTIRHMIPMAKKGPQGESSADRMEMVKLKNKWLMDKVLIVNRLKNKRLKNKELKINRLKINLV